MHVKSTEAGGLKFSMRITERVQLAESGLRAQRHILKEGQNEVAKVLREDAFS